MEALARTGLKQIPYNKNTGLFSFWKYKKCIILYTLMLFQ